MEQQAASIEINFRGNPEPVVFDEIIGYQLGSGFLGVMVGQHTFIYPSDTIEYVVHTTKE
jgi:hypothetical protein